jgi:hypothetical protein
MSGFHYDYLVFRQGNDVIAVADTKYKDAGKLTTDDVAQVIAYADRMETDEAILVYPTELDTDGILMMIYRDQNSNS